MTRIPRRRPQVLNYIRIDEVQPLDQEWAAINSFHFSS